MFDALYIGATGLRGQQMQLDSIAQNVANLHTVGYRRNVVSFAEIAAALAPQTAREIDASQATTGNVRMVGAGALPTMTLATGTGELRETGDALNVAISGVGFLEVTRTDGTPAYTRAGQLSVNNDGMLTAADGSPLSARIQIPTDAHDLRISAAGVVTTLVGDRADAIELGKIELANFSVSSGLRPIGDNLYAATAQSGEPRFFTPGDNGLGTLRQGFLENSNVQMTDELVNLMLAQRAFEMNSKVVQAADQMLSITNGLFR